jgi:adenosylcobinamide kinase/adenosylcobinamide-phosphate guanylyltransferase
MGSKIIFVTGGARSGKSSFALKDASGTGGERAYIATAEALDVEMRERIQKHREDRGGAGTPLRSHSGLLTHWLK